MKTINITFEDKEFNELIVVKEKLSWHDFIIDLVKFLKENLKENETERQNQKEEELHPTEW